MLPFIGISAYLIFFGVGAYAHIPVGRNMSGRCVFQNPDVSFVWEHIHNDTSGAFYSVEKLNESMYVKSDDFPTQFYQIPQPFVDLRYRLEEGYQPYLNHPDFKTNYQELYQDEDRRHKFLHELLNISITRQPRRMAVFNDVITNNYGLIVRPSTCEYLRNGGCTYMKHNRIYSINAGGPVKEVVVSLTAGAFGTWHFPMECFVALAALPTQYLTTATFHVPSKSPYISSWLHLLNIPNEHISDAPTLHAKQLLVPQMGRCCEMYETQIEWLRQDVAKLPKEHISYSREILLIKRSGSRQVQNAQAVEKTVMEFAKKNRYKVTTHGDRNLPSLREQIDRFSTPTIVIAPHGAGLLFTAFSPSNVCIIEFMPQINPECYARIAYIRRLKYVMYMMDGTRIELDDVRQGLAKCAALAEKDEPKGKARTQLPTWAPVVLAVIAVSLLLWWFRWRKPNSNNNQLA